MTLRQRCRLWCKVITFSHNFALIGRVISVFRQEMDPPDPSEMGTCKSLFPRRHIIHGETNGYSINGEKENFLNWEDESVIHFSNK